MLKVSWEINCQYLEMFMIMQNLSVTNWLWWNILEKKIKDSYKSKLVKYFENKFNKRFKEDQVNNKKSIVSLIPLHNEKRKYKIYLFS